MRGQVKAAKRFCPARSLFVLVIVIVLIIADVIFIIYSIKQ